MPSHKEFIALAEHIAQWSKDPSTKVGAVVVDDKKRVIGLGYNGFPRGIKDDGRLFNRELKYELIVHAEVNAILNSVVLPEGGTLYSTFFPCPRCASVIVQAGITSVYFIENASDKRHEDAIALSRKILTEAGVETLCLK